MIVALFLYHTGKRLMFRRSDTLPILHHNNSKKCKCFTPLRIAKLAKTPAFYSTFGGWIMRATRIPADEQYRLIMECRTSGLTDHEWGLQHDIKPGTFYNWVKHLRKAGCPEIPNAASHHHSPRHQEVVKIKLTSPDKTTGNLIPSFQEPEPCRTVPWSFPLPELFSGYQMEQTLYCFDRLSSF